MENKFYVVDINCTGHADIVTTLPEEFWFLIAECDDRETANNEAEKYKIRVQEKIDKVTGNYDYDEAKVYEELVSFSREIDKTIENYDYDDYE